MYFGVDAQQMRDATARVLSRLEDVPPDRATVKLDALVEDFRISAAASRSMIDEMLRRGLLERRGERGLEFSVTEKFRSYADANIIEPLPRSRAKILLNHIADLAWHFNRTAIRNKYEIDTLAVIGAYMNLEPELAEVTIAITGRRRAPAERPAAGRATQALQGHEQIRELVEGQSSYLRVQFFQGIDDIPRPFSVIFQRLNFRARIRG
jgi:DNA-binding IclR family transcriptional regulator